MAHTYACPPFLTLYLAFEGALSRVQEADPSISHLEHEREGWRGPDRLSVLHFGQERRCDAPPCSKCEGGVVGAAQTLCLAFRVREGWVLALCLTFQARVKL